METELSGYKYNVRNQLQISMSATNASFPVRLATVLGEALFVDESRTQQIININILYVRHYH